MGTGLDRNLQSCGRSAVTVIEYCLWVVQKYYLIFHSAFLAGILIIFSLIGGALFTIIEAPPEQKIIKAILRQRNSTLSQLRTKIAGGEKESEILLFVQLYEGQYIGAIRNGTVIEGGEEAPVWTFWGSVYYCVTTFLLVGYGNLAPKTDLGRVIAVIYCGFTVPITSIINGEVGDILIVIMDTTWHLARKSLSMINRKVTGVKGMPRGGVVGPRRMGPTNFPPVPPKPMKLQQNLNHNSLRSQPSTPVAHVTHSLPGEISGYHVTHSLLGGTTGNHVTHSLPGHLSGNALKGGRRYQDCGRHSRCASIPQRQTYDFCQHRLAVPVSESEFKDCCEHSRTVLMSPRECQDYCKRCRNDLTYHGNHQGYYKRSMKISLRHNHVDQKEVQYEPRQRTVSFIDFEPSDLSHKCMGWVKSCSYRTISNPLSLSESLFIVFNIADIDLKTKLCAFLCTSCGHGLDAVSSCLHHPSSDVVICRWPFPHIHHVIERDPLSSTRAPSSVWPFLLSKQTVQTEPDLLPSCLNTGPASESVPGPVVNVAHMKILTEQVSGRARSVWIMLFCSPDRKTVCFHHHLTRMVESPVLSGLLTTASPPCGGGILTPRDHVTKCGQSLGSATAQSWSQKHLALVCTRSHTLSVLVKRTKTVLALPIQSRSENVRFGLKSRRNSSGTASSFRPAFERNNRSRSGFSMSRDREEKSGLDLSRPNNINWSGNVVVSSSYTLDKPTSRAQTRPLIYSCRSSVTNPGVTCSGRTTATQHWPDVQLVATAGNSCRLTKKHTWLGPQNTFVLAVRTSRAVGPDRNGHNWPAARGGGVSTSGHAPKACMDPQVCSSALSQVLGIPEVAVMFWMATPWRFLLLGQAIRAGLRHCLYRLKSLRRRRRRRRLVVRHQCQNRNVNMADDEQEEEEDDEELSGDEEEGKEMDEQQELPFYLDVMIEEGTPVPTLSVLAITFLYIGIGALIMSYLSITLSYFDSFWFIFISLVTIGYGDVVPTDPTLFLLLLIYLFFGLSLMSNVISETSSFFSTSIQKTKSIMLDALDIISTKKVILIRKEKAQRAKRYWKIVRDHVKHDTIPKQLIDESRDYKASVMKEERELVRWAYKAYFKSAAMPQVPPLQSEPRVIYVQSPSQAIKTQRGWSSSGDGQGKLSLWQRIKRGVVKFFSAVGKLLRPKPEPKPPPPAPLPAGGFFYA